MNGSQTGFSRISKGLDEAPLFISIPVHEYDKYFRWIGNQGNRSLLG